MKKKRLLLGIIILLAVICLCPFPRRVNKTLQGVYHAEDAQSVSVEIALKGWWLDYLFFEDRLSLSGTISSADAADDADFDFSRFVIKNTVTKLSDSMYGTSAFYYRSSTNQMEHQRVLFTKRFEDVLFASDGTDSAYIAAGHNKTTEDVDSLFSEYLG